MSALVDRLVRVGPHAGAHRIALRASVSVVGPLLVLLAIDHLSWSIYAAFGAFTSLYGRERVDRQRVVLQLTAGAWQTGVVTLGALVAVSGQRAWISIPVATVVALTASYASARQGWHPPGSLFQVFGFAAVASVPGTWHGILPAFVVAAGAATFAVLVGNIGAVWRRVRRTCALEAPGHPIGGAREGVWRYAAQSAAGVAVAGTIATGAGIGRPYWAMVSAVVPLVAKDLLPQLVRGIHRIVGTAVGLGVAWLIFQLDPSGLGVVIVTALLQAAAELLVGRNYALALVFVTPLALVMVHMVAPVPVGSLLADRGLETLIGAVIGMAIGYAARPRRAR